MGPQADAHGLQLRHNRRCAMNLSMADLTVGTNFYVGLGVTLCAILLYVQAPATGLAELPACMHACCAADETPPSEGAEGGGKAAAARRRRVWAMGGCAAALCLVLAIDWSALGPRNVHGGGGSVAPASPLVRGGGDSGAPASASSTPLPAAPGALASAKAAPRVVKRTADGSPSASDKRKRAAPAASGKDVPLGKKATPDASSKKGAASGKGSTSDATSGADEASRKRGHDEQSGNDVSPASSDAPGHASRMRSKALKKDKKMSAGAAPPATVAGSIKPNRTRTLSLQ